MAAPRLRNGIPVIILDTVIGLNYFLCSVKGTRRLGHRSELHSTNFCFKGLIPLFLPALWDVFCVRVSYPLLLLFVCVLLHLINYAIEFYYDTTTKIVMYDSKSIIIMSLMMVMFYDNNFD